VTLYLTSHNFACLNVEVSRLSNIWFFLALTLLLCGVWFGRSSAYPSLIRFFYRTILFSLFCLQVVRKLVVLFCSLFDFVVCGYYGTKETIEFKNKKSTIHQPMDKVKSHSLRWMKVNNINVCLNIHM